MKSLLAPPASLLLFIAVLVPGCSSPTREVPLTTVTQPDVALPKASEKQLGTLSLQVTDTRPEKPKVGKLSGRIGANAVLVISGGLEPRLAELLKDALGRAGYTVVASGHPTLAAEIVEFNVYANGWTQGAKEKVRLQLRDKDGRVAWEQTVKGEDGGMDLVDSFAEKSMNVALTRMLTNAIHEFKSEPFGRSVKNASGENKD